jgi:hypothetical protein
MNVIPFAEVNKDSHEKFQGLIASFTFLSLPSVEKGARILRFLMQLMASIGRKMITITVVTDMGSVYTPIIYSKAILLLLRLIEVNYRSEFSTHSLDIFGDKHNITNAHAELVDNEKAIRD